MSNFGLLKKYENRARGEERSSTLKEGNNCRSREEYPAVNRGLLACRLADRGNIDVGKETRVIPCRHGNTSLHLLPPKVGSSRISKTRLGSVVGEKEGGR